MFIPDQNFSIPDTWSCIQGQKDSKSRIRIHIKEFRCFQPKKIVSKLSEIWSTIFIPDPDPVIGKMITEPLRKTGKLQYCGLDRGNHQDQPLALDFLTAADPMWSFF
jgi:hypothetical protein